MNHSRHASAIGRPPQIEDPTNRYFIHVISRRLVPLFIWLGVHPNVVSLLGLAAGLTAAGFYTHYERPLFAGLGFLFMIAWHILDGADGHLARLTGQQSEFGKFVDGLCDYGTVASIYIALAFGYLRNEGEMLVLPAFLLAGASHILQSVFYEGQRQFFTDCFNGLAPDEASRDKVAHGSGPHDLWTRALRYYGKLQSMGATHFGIQALCAENEGAREKYVETQARLMRWWSLLANNLRTLLIFLSCILATPLYYFAYQLIVGAALLGLLLFMQRRANRRFLLGRD